MASKEPHMAYMYRKGEDGEIESKLFDLNGQGVKALLTREKWVDDPGPLKRAKAKDG